MSNTSPDDDRANAGAQALRAIADSLGFRTASAHQSLFFSRVLNAAGDAVLGWARLRSNTSIPVRAAAFEAPARPELRRFRARGAAGRVLLDLELSAAGRVLVRVRRAGAAQPLDGFVVSGPAGRSSVAVPPRVRSLARRGRYVLSADTGGHDPATAVREATVVVADG